MEAERERIAEGRATLAEWERQKPRNYFDSDPNLQHVLQQHLGVRYAAFVPMLERTGALAATLLDELARSCNRDENLPQLRRYNGIGERVEEVVFTAAHHELGTHFWGSGVLSLFKEPGNETVAGGLLYLLDHNGEAGHACPLACTAGLAKLLQQVGSDEQRAFLLPSLLESDYTARLHASQFVTEVQGGSDVGSNDCLAVPARDLPGKYRISGEKWFCSVADAALFVVSARVDGGPEGTRGLGLFLVPRLLHGRPNGFAIRRLKYKLGTRSMASGEIDFDGAVGEPIGPLEHGFKNLIGIVLDASRLHNALAAAGAMRRATIEAQTFARVRRAFGRPIIDFPAVQQTLAGMKVQTAAAVATTFRLLALTDRLARGGDDAELRAARRIHVMVNKYATAVACTNVVRAGIEVLGGNGTIEEFSVLPRLYRDAIVVESWEGTHNTLCAQVLRDFRDRGLHRPYLEELGGVLDHVRAPVLGDHQERARALLEETAGRVARLVGGEARFAERHVRSVVDRLVVLHAYVSLLLEADHERTVELDGEKENLLELYRLQYIDPPAEPMDAPELDELQRALSLTL